MLVTKKQNGGIIMRATKAKGNIEKQMLVDTNGLQEIKALFRFAEDGTTPDFSGALMMCFSFISSQMQRDKEKYIDICVKRAKAGKKGGKQKQANLANANCAKQNQAN